MPGAAHPPSARAIVLRAECPSIISGQSHSLSGNRVAKLHMLRAPSSWRCLHLAYAPGRAADAAQQFSRPSWRQSAAARQGRHGQQGEGAVSGGAGLLREVRNSSRLTLPSLLTSNSAMSMDTSWSREPGDRELGFRPPRLSPISSARSSPAGPRMHRPLGGGTRILIAQDGSRRSQRLPPCRSAVICAAPDAEMRVRRNDAVAMLDRLTELADAKSAPRKGGGGG